MVPFDLRKRIFDFVLEVISLVKDLPDSRINRIFVDQIVRSASSIGANYEEADGSPTKKEFAYKMGIVKKEAKETKYWLQLIRVSNEKKYSENLNILEVANEELIRIISKIIINSSS